MAFHRPAPRGWAAIAVILSWAASLGWLGLRLYGHPDDDALSGEASLRLAPGDAWLAVMVGDVQVGTAAVTLDTLSPGFRISESSTLELPQDTGLMHSARITRIVVGPTLSLEEMTTSWSRPGRHTDMSISSAARELSAHYPPNPLSYPFRSTSPFTLMHIFPYQIALAKGMRKNRELKEMMIEGWPASARISRVWIGGDTVVTYPDSTVVDAHTGNWKAVTTISAPGMNITVDGVSGPYRITTDTRGRLQGLETLFGVRWVRGNFEVSMNAFRQSIATHTSTIRNAYPTVRPLAAYKPTSEPNVERRFLVSHRDGSPLPPKLLALLAGGRQVVQGDTLVILPTGAPQATTEPAIGTEPESVDPLIPGMLRWADPRGRSTVESLLKFVRDSVTVDTSSKATDDGATAMKLHRGRPDAMARVFVGLARNAHITARYVIGVKPDGDVLLTHAWAEVLNSRGEWVAVDPVFGHAEAATSLIRLGWGGSSYPDDMLPMIANAKFTPLAASATP